MTLEDLEKIAMMRADEQIERVRKAIEESLKIIVENGDDFPNRKVAAIIGELQLTMTSRYDAMLICECYAVCLQMLHKARTSTSMSFPS